jgi:DNA-binding transcriptional LysR family regulator
MDLLRTDVNLLVALDVLLQERNVTRAAVRLSISQPAMSAQLTKLRRLFDDPILIPAESGRGMTPTALAIVLHPALRSALNALEAAVSMQLSFDPEHDTHTFKIAASDNAMVAVGLPLVERLCKEYSSTRIAFQRPDPSTIAQQMERGEIDLLIDADRQIPPSMKARLLMDDTFVMAQRKGHPRGTGPLTLDDFCQLRHVLISTGDDNQRGYMDEYLASINRQRDVVLVVPHVLLVPSILEFSDYVCTVASRFLTQQFDQLDYFEVPFTASAFRLQIAWHARNHKDPANAWLRNLIQTLIDGNNGPMPR